MPDSSRILAALTFAYGAAAVGLLAALAARAWLRRRGRQPLASEAAWCGFLPAFAILLVPPMSTVSPHAACWLAGAHELWHGCERVVHASPTSHALLHVANLALVGFALCCVARTVYSASRIRAFTSQLRFMAEVTPIDVAGTPVYRLRTALPVALTAGFLRPAVYLSDGLLQQLSPAELEAIMAHEGAHRRRRDGVVGTLLALLYQLFPLPGGRSLQREWERAAERACDAEAAQRTGSPCDVAAALLKVARLVSRPQPVIAGVTAFAAASGDAIEGRIQALLMLPTGSLLPARRRHLSAGLVVSSLATLYTVGFWLAHFVDLFTQH
jgi:beta-lactamase regulating signal transducer with metallopeptidase domain